MAERGVEGGLASADESLIRRETREIWPFEPRRDL